MAGSPLFWAQMLRKQAGLGDTCPTDLDHLLTWCEIELAELPLSGFLGMHMCVEGQHGIMIKEGQNPGQRRFTIAHELGHFAIPHHSTPGVRECLEDDLVGVRVSGPVEREANEFAAELLMPRAPFARDIAHRPACFRSVKELAAPAKYDVSVTACALRWINLCPDPCALVCVEGGRIKWKWGAAGFKYALPQNGSTVPAESIAAAVLRGEAPCDEAETIPCWSWIHPRRNTKEVLESTFYIPALDQVLSLIAVVEEDRETEEDD
ncbi:MAG: ImmA/IrrE family metallo-endopeptidase [Gemmatimonadota bacterium]